MITFPPARKGPLNDRAQVLRHALDGRVQPVSVSAFHEEDVDPFRSLGVAQDRQVVASEVAGESDPHAAPAVLDVEHDDGAAQDVARFHKRQPDSGRDLERSVIRKRYHLAENPFDVFGPVERLHRPDVGLAPFDQAADVARVGFLDHGGVFQHRRAEVPRRGGRENGAAVAFLVEQGQRARMVDVRVRKDHGVEHRSVQRELVVAPDGFAAMALEEPALEQHGGAGRPEQMLRSGDGLGPAQKFQLDRRRPFLRHEYLLPRS